MARVMSTFGEMVLNVGSESAFEQMSYATVLNKV